MSIEGSLYHGSRRTLFFNPVLDVQEHARTLISVVRYTGISVVLISENDERAYSPPAVEDPNMLPRKLVTQPEPELPQKSAFSQNRI